MTDSFQQVTDHVWFYPHNPDSDSIQPGVGAIITGSETVLVDAGSGPPHAREMQAALLKLNAPPVKWVIYTHYHWDHTFGAQVWSGSTVIAHSDCRTQLLERYGGQPWSPLRVEEEARQQPVLEAALNASLRAIGDWQDFQLIVPHLTFSGSLSLMLDDLTVTLRHIGGQHAPDSITVLADEVLFLGDCYYLPPLTVRQPDDTLDYAMMKDLLAENAAYYIAGHSRPRSRAEFAGLLDQRKR